jgi:hypothetical protein
MAGPPPRPFVAGEDYAFASADVARAGLPLQYLSLLREPTRLEASL